VQSRRDLLKTGLAAVATGFANGENAGALTRHTCFYQVGRQVVDVYADPDAGLPNDDGHIHVFSHSHASAYADATLAAYIHDAGASFKYAPAFDLHEFTGWRTADEEQLPEYVVSLEQFQNDLSRCATISRNRAGGRNRIAFAPMAAVYTDARVHLHLRQLINWHCNQGGGEDEIPCFNTCEC
jgi:hypothetical protein